MFEDAENYSILDPNLAYLAYDFEDVKPRSMAVWAGHVAFIEWVDYDTNGNPTNIYVTEANVGSHGTYIHGYDALVKKFTLEEFKNKSQKEFLGYVISKK